MKRAFVHCKVRPGMFENEYLVTVDQSSALVSSGNVNVPASVTIQGVDGNVRVYVVEESGDQALVELPGEAVMGGRRTWVPTASFARG